MRFTLLFIFCFFGVDAIAETESNEFDDEVIITFEEILYNSGRGAIINKEIINRNKFYLDKIKNNEYATNADLKTLHQRDVRICNLIIDEFSFFWNKLKWRTIAFNDVDTYLPKYIDRRDRILSRIIVEDNILFTYHDQQYLRKINAFIGKMIIKKMVKSAKMVLLQNTSWNGGL